MRSARHGSTQSAPRYRSWSRGSSGCWLADARYPCAGVVPAATRRRPVARPVARARRAVAQPVAAAVAGADRKPTRRPDGDGAGAVGHEHVLRRRAVAAPSRRAIPAPYALARPGGTRRSRPRSRAPSTAANPRPAKRRSGPRCVNHSVSDGDRLAARPAIHLDAQLERHPRPVEPIARGRGESSTCSTHRSIRSASTFVNVHATSRLKPMTTAGSPGMVTP